MLILHVTICTGGHVVSISSMTMHIDQGFGILDLLGTFMADVGILVHTMRLFNGT